MRSPLPRSERWPGPASLAPSGNSPSLWIAPSASRCHPELRRSRSRRISPPAQDSFPLATAIYLPRAFERLGPCSHRRADHWSAAQSLPRARGRCPSAHTGADEVPASAQGVMTQAGHSCPFGDIHLLPGSLRLPLAVILSAGEAGVEGSRPRRKTRFPWPLRYTCLAPSRSFVGFPSSG